MPVPGPAPATTQGLAPGGGGESSNDTISARLGISAVYGPAHRQIRAPATALRAAIVPSPRRRRQVCPLPARIALSYLTLWAQRSSSQAQLSCRGPLAWRQRTTASGAG